MRKIPIIHELLRAHITNASVRCLLPKIRYSDIRMKPCPNADVLNNQEINDNNYKTDTTCTTTTPTSSSTSTTTTPITTTTTTTTTATSRRNYNE